MTSSLVDELVDATLNLASVYASPSVALIGNSPVALLVRERLERLKFAGQVAGTFDPFVSDRNLPPWSELAGVKPDIVVVCSDKGKEPLLEALAHVLDAADPLPQIVIGGSGHFDFNDEMFEELNAPALVPSYATGHPHTKVHLFQCLRAASIAGLTGAIVEFGAFKGGTTAWLARVSKRLGLAGPIIGFDSWSGFPPRRSVRDLYVHDRCVFTDVDAVRKYVEPFEVELVVGDISNTVATRLSETPILLAFVDTDNYSPAAAALRVVVENLVVGGSIVLDHFQTSSDYLYTLGERMAAAEVLGARPGLLQLHGTGVFTRIL